MNDVWLISDGHLEHPAIPKFRPLCTSVDDNTDQIVRNWNRLVKQGDTVICTGDMAWNDHGLTILQGLPGEKVLVMGNHDLQTDCTMAGLLRTYKKIVGLMNYPGGFWISHAPIHPDELWDKKNIHGHMHCNALRDPRYINVNVDFTGMKPVRLRDIKSGEYTTHDKVPYETDRHR